METTESLLSLRVIWRGKKYGVHIHPDASVKNLGDELQKLTDVWPDTMRLFVPKTSTKGSELLSPFSDEHSQLSLRKASIVEGKSIRMLGVSKDEIDQVLEDSKVDLRIAGFNEEEKRMKQRTSYGPNGFVKQKPRTYTFCDFRTLQLPGIELNPPASEALKRMHMLAEDPGILAIMDKHRWRVGIMTEMAPVGYVGVSPKCILGFNKNHGEEISLRLRTDDLKGFRKYESIKKTLLHELAHMVYSEHDANFYALDKQLNQEATSLDWTKSRGHTLNGVGHVDEYEEETYISDNRSRSQKLGGSASDQLGSARASSVSAAYRRLAFLANSSGVYDEPYPDYSGYSRLDRPDVMDDEPDPDENSKHEPNPNYFGSNRNQAMETLHSGIQIIKSIDVPDPDDWEAKERNLGDRNNHKACTEPDPDEAHAGRTVETEPDPDKDLTLQAISTVKIDEKMKVDEPEPDGSEEKKEHSGNGHIQRPHWNKAYNEPDPDESQASRVVPAEIDPDNALVASQASTMIIDEPDPDNQELQRIQDPVTVVCGRLQKALETLRAEVNPTEATASLQTLFKIIRNVIEHPNEMKFKRLRKANPIIQKNIAYHKAAMEILQLAGFVEEVINDGTGNAESYLVLKRNDPGLLWLVKSFLEASGGC